MRLAAPLTDKIALGISTQETSTPLRHSLIVRVTHWINTVTFLALVISGAAILLAHPRLYWGETGAFGSPALIELPLSLNLDQSGWGRGLHFLSAWVCVLNGTVYLLSGLAARHFKMGNYEVLQRRTYLIVVFVLFPLMIVTGLAMSPAVTSVFPIIVGIFGGHQSARTVHFAVTNLLVLFLIAHVAMVFLNGFKSLMRGMIRGVGGPAGSKKAATAAYRGKPAGGPDAN